MRLLLFLAALMLAACSTPVVNTAPATPAKQEAKPAGRAKRNRPRGESGRFDFYVLALSWSPGYCATPAGARDTLQCAPQRQFGFVLHGLWPQYEKGGWPQNCTTGKLDARLIDPMLDIMPSRKLVRHEWEKHGTCSGLDAQAYLEESREAFEQVKIPAVYQAPLQQITVDPEKLQLNFATANPSFPRESFNVVCTNNGRFLQEVRVCLNQDLTPRACNAEVARAACRSNSVILRPVR